MKHKLDQYLFEVGLAQSRSQAVNLIKLRKVTVDGVVATKSQQLVNKSNKVEVVEDKYVSRAGNKLASAAEKLNLDFMGKVVLDIGSSTGGFTDYALQNGAKKVIGVDVGTNQLHSTLRISPRVELHEKTDILEVTLKKPVGGQVQITQPNIILLDLSFVSLRQILPHVAGLANKSTQIVAMVKPQFEADSSQKNKGVVKNNTIRRQVLKDFELWSREFFVIQAKADSEVSGQKGNVERFYLLKPKVAS